MSNNYFIPAIKTINGIKIPSTPFYCSNNEPLYVGDVFQLTYGADTTVYLADLKHGQYIGSNNDANAEELIWQHDQMNIKVLGSSVEFPDLLALLSN
jgi:hypothetical protein